MADPKSKPHDEPVLDINTIGLGTPIRIDGKRYFIRAPNKLTLSALMELQDLRPRSYALMQKIEKLSSTERIELSDLLLRCCRLVLDAPPAVQQALGDVERIQILNVFIKLRPNRTPQTAGATNGNRANRSTGGYSSRNSRRVTKASRRSTGSPVSLSPSSGRT